LAVIGGVGPVARRIERKGAVAVAAGGAGLGGEVGLTLVDVGDGQRPTGRQIAAGYAVGPIVLGHLAGADTTDHRRVVGAVDGDGDQLTVAGVGGHRGKAVGEALPGAELLDRRLAVGGVVGPVAGGVEREGAVGAAGAGLRYESGLT